MLTPGDVVEVNLGNPTGSEAGLLRPAIVVTAVRILRGGPNVVQVVPLTRTLRPSGVEVIVDADERTGLTATSAAQCQHVRSVATHRCGRTIGSVGPLVLAQIRDVLGLLFDV